MIPSQYAHDGSHQQHHITHPSIFQVNKPTLKVLHISDTHFDKDYTQGAKVDCGEPLCCRQESGMANGDDLAAGKYGDYMCDSPEILLDSMFEHASSTHKVRFGKVFSNKNCYHQCWLFKDAKSQTMDFSSDIQTKRLLKNLLLQVIPVDKHTKIIFGIIKIVISRINPMTSFSSKIKCPLNYLKKYL